MRITPTKLDGVLMIEMEAFADHRGYFMESYNEEKFKAAGLDYRFVQDNAPFTIEAGTLRGLHYQLAPKAQTKLVRCLTGAIYDVAVDLRRESPTFGEWVGVILSESNRRQLLVPKGFAHGFCTLTPNTQVLYKVDEYYSRDHDRGLRWNDPDLGIEWPTDRVILSDKDQEHPGFKDLGTYF